MAKNLKEAICIMVDKYESVIGEAELRKAFPILGQRQDERTLCQEKQIPYFLAFLRLLWAEEHISKQDIEIKKSNIIRIGKRSVDIPKPVDSLSGYEILTRGFIGATKYVTRRIAELGGVNALTEKQLVQTDEWPIYVDPSFIKRKIAVLKAEDLEARIKEFERGGKLFVKPVVKPKEGHGMVITIDEVRRFPESITGGLPYQSQGIKPGRELIPLSADYMLIASEPVEFESDEDRTLEYRTWVVNSTPVIITRYGQAKNLDVPKRVVDFAHDFTIAHKMRLPPHYVVDIGLEKTKGPIVVEINGISEAGDTNKEVFEKVLNAYVH